MESAVKFLDRFLTSLNNGSYVLPCWRDGEINRYSLPNYTCIDGKIENCNIEYCSGRGINDVCCILQKRIYQGQQIVIQAQTSTLGPEDAADKEYVYIAIIAILAVALGILLLFFLCRRRQINQTCRLYKLDLTHLARKDQDNDSGLASAVSSTDSNNRNGLMSSNGSLNKKKIHAQPEVVESHINMKPGHAHQLYLQEHRPAQRGEDEEETSPLTIALP